MATGAQQIVVLVLASAIIVITSFSIVPWLLVEGNAQEKEGSAEPSSQSQRLCSREELRNGQWSEPDRNATPPYIPTERWHRSCYGKDPNKLEGYYKSSWSAPCAFDELQEDTFCALVENQTLAFIGDSITWQQFEAIEGSLKSTDVQRNSNFILVRACSNRTTMLWSKNNYILVGGVMQILQTYEPDIVVTNRGAHYLPDEELVPHLNATLATFKTWQESHDMRLIWRTTAPGVPSCSSEYAPNNDLNDVLASRVHNRSSWYGIGQRSVFSWWDFERQNALVMNLIESSDVQFEVIDAFEMYTTRPDLRISQKDDKEKDCLHQCLPGVPDESNRVLQHILQQQQQ